jgi:hypothetical protein
MKKIIIIIGMLLTTFILAYATSPTIKINDYQPKNHDEKVIKQLLVKLQEGYNTYNPEIVLAAHAAGASIAGSGTILSKEEYVHVVPRRLAKSKELGLKIYFYAPQHIDIKEDSGKVEVPYDLIFDNIKYSEKGIFKAKLVKKQSDWLISESRWKVTEKIGKWPLK